MKKMPGEEGEETPELSFSRMGEHGKKVAVIWQPGKGLSP